MSFINKVLFLYQSEAKLIIYFIFIKTKIINIFVKNSIKAEKKIHKKFLSQKKITHDYFSSNAFNFLEIGNKYKNFNYLEIGSFEGNSVMFMSKNFNNSQIHCVDNWVGTEEYENLEFSLLEKNFDFNTSEFNNLKKFKMYSDDYFALNKIYYDIIYIDGYHKGSQVLKDFKNSWKYLKSNGIIIFDDYIWQFFKEIKDNPCYVINRFLNEIIKDVKIIKVSNSQLFIQKKKSNFYFI